MSIVGVPVQDIVTTATPTSPTYGQIKSRVASWLNRTDLTSQIPDFVNIAMTKLERDNNYSFMEQEYSAVLAVGWFNKPDYFKAPKYAKVTYSNINNNIEQLEWGALQTIYWDTTYTGVPEAYAISNQDSRIYVRPTPNSDTNYTIYFRYYKYTPAMTSDSEYNIWTTTHWDALLYGALLEASVYLMNDERVPLWKAKYDEAVINIKKAETDMEMTTFSNYVLPTLDVI